MRLLFASLALLSPVLAHQEPAPEDELFDYIIVGGGTCGLVLANRLSENPDISVAVIEAGESVLHSSNVTQIENYFASLGTSIDWQYESVPQQYTNSRTLVYDSGKALGGTSTINGATYIRAQKAQIDAWEQLGNVGWNWETLWPYYRKSENFQPPSPQLIARGAAYESSAHGINGLLGVGWSNYTIDGDVHTLLNETWQAVGIPYNQDQSNGDLRGFSVFPSTIDSVHNIRADAARSYYWPASNRKNLHVYTGTLAKKLVWHEHEKEHGTSISASGVEIQLNSGKHSRTLHAKKEVILSAGSLKSPVILESSGVGNPTILHNHGIGVKVGLPTVGENLQDQPNVGIAASAEKNWTGYPPFSTFATASDLFGTNVSNVGSHVSGQIPAYAATIVSHSNNAYTLNMVEKQLQIQADLIFNQSTPCVEALAFPTEKSMIGVFWGLLPFSRESVHLNSTDPSSNPLINPNFFMLEWDAILQTAAANLVRKAIHTAPLGDLVGENVVPNNTVVPQDAGTEEWLPWFKDNCECDLGQTMECITRRMLMSF